MEANKTPKKHAHAWVWQILLALAAYLALFLLARYTVVTAAFLAVPCIFVGARWGVWAGAAFYVCAGALGFVLDEPLALGAAAVFLIPTAAGWYLLSRPRGGWESLVWSFAALLLPLGAGAILLNRWAAGDVAGWIVEVLLARAQGDPGVAAGLFGMLLSRDMASGALTMQQAQELIFSADIGKYLADAASVASLRQMLEASIPVLAAGCLAYGAAANFLLPRLWVQKAGGKVGKLPPVEGWRMPKVDGYCLAGALALGYLLLLAGGEAYAAMGQMLVGILGAAFRGVGICVATYFLLVRVRSRAGRVAIAAGLSLLAPGLFTAIGVAEQLFGIRKRFVIIKKKP